MFESSLSLFLSFSLCPTYIYAFKYFFASSENYIIFIYTRRTQKDARASSSLSIQLDNSIRQPLRQSPLSEGSLCNDVVAWKNKQRREALTKSRTSSICLDEKSSASLNRRGRLDLSGQGRRGRRSITNDDAQSMCSRKVANRPLARRRSTGFKRTKISRAPLATPARCP